MAQTVATFAPNPVERAIMALDGPTKASHICGMSVAAIYKWRRSGVVSDAKAAILLAEASGVPLKELAGLHVFGPGPRAPRPERVLREYGRTRRRSTGCTQPSVSESIPATEQDTTPLPEAIGF